MKKLGGLFAVVILPFLLAGAAYGKDKPVVPDQLKPWTGWALHGHEEQLYCSPAFNNQARIQCDWPSTIDFVLDKSQGRFSQQWFIQYERWIQLPGNGKNWPHDVLVDGVPVAVLDINGVPKIKLSQGDHVVSGSFTWVNIPEYLMVPAHTGIVSLRVNEKSIDFPNLDASGRLWLQARREGEKIENRLSLQTFRLIEDNIPLKVVTSINLDVSGSAREVELGPILSTESFVPFEVKSMLPARLEPDGKLRVQIRPGQWNITITNRHIGPLSSLRFTPPEDGFWPNEEVWVFRSNPNLRVVELEGVAPIDPMQTSLPGGWKSFPAYRMQGGDNLVMKEIKRGDPHPAPDQLSLQRQVWLRFDGSGYTIKDTVSGSKTAAWRFEMNDPLQLGRVAVDGKEQFITRLGESGKKGVELRKGILNLVADSEYKERISTLPATGWDHDFQQVSATLHIPPGWRLIHAAGMDTIYGTWVTRWTLLDFFIVLIFTIAVAKLFSKPMAGLAFVSLVLMYHEHDAPRWIWLALLVGIALLRHLPASKFKTVIKVYQAIVIFLLIVIAVPFSIKQLRVGLYPQLEKPWYSMEFVSHLPKAMDKEEPVEAQDEAVQEAPMIQMKGQVLPHKRSEMKMGLDLNGYRARKSLLSSDVPQVAQYDPSMVNQTGPGLPGWQWNAFQMGWSGPVQKDQLLSFVFIGPKTNLVLAFLRVLLLVVLALGILGFRFKKGRGVSFEKLKAMFTVMLLAVVVGVCSPPSARAGEIPSAGMLEELRTRLLEKEQCFPGCADISEMRMDIGPQKMEITLHAVAQIDAAIPLPGNARHWLPQEVRLGDHPVEAMYRVDETLWILVPPGQHIISLTGRLPRQKTVQLPLSLKPHHVSCVVDGWTVEGIHENGIADNQIQFKRIVDEQGSESRILETGVLPPFLQIERTLMLGLNWKIETVVRRIGPVGSAAVFSYPLMPGESIVSEGIRVKNNKAQLNMTSRQSVLRWKSVIEKSDELHLKHPETDLWTEIWRVDVSPIFHMETSGIPVIFHQQGNRWYPTWHPWPGEEVKLTITRPRGVAGKTITIDRTHLVVTPGQRSADTSLFLSLRSSQGGQHTIRLPDKARLQEVLINGTVQPIRQEGRNVPLPIKPGSQEISLKWREPVGITTIIKTPVVALGTDSVNSNIDIQLPRNRWPFFMGGPLMGPAVLFWSVLLVIALVAFGLSRTGLTPLRFHHWFLLGIGMSQSSLTGCILVVGWLIALELRKKVKPDTEASVFNILQIGIGLLTLIALGMLVDAINQGLLGHPDMNIVGNGSHAALLKWYEDYSTNILPQAWVLSLPMYVYRIAMLAWALWLSFYLVRLLKWGWGNFTEPMIWRKIEQKKKLEEEELEQFEIDVE